MRLFIGIACMPLPSITQELQHLHTAAREPRNQLRVVPTANLHLTVKFLGFSDAGKVPVISAVLDALASNTAPFTLQLAGAGSFHGALWLGVREHPVLTALAVQLNAALAPLGFAPETKPFRPHLTLARLGRNPAFDTRLWQHERREQPWGDIDVGQLILFRSETLSDGARYSVLHRSALKR